MTPHEELFEGYKKETGQMIQSMNLPKAVEYLLRNIYYGDFTFIGGILQHPEGLDFYEWLHIRELISTEELNRIKSESQTK